MTTTVGSKLVRHWIEDFEKDYFTRRLRNPKSETTWQIDYQRVFNKLPLSEVLTSEILIQVVTSTKPDTRTRKRYCIALGALARYAGLTCNLKLLRGDYSPLKTKQRYLPTDLQIIQQFNCIDNDAWRWCYGMLATYGLRPHELFHLDYNRIENGIISLKVLDGKTGGRLIFPFYPEWLEQFNLRAVQLPKCSGKNNSDLGSRVTQAFRRFNMPFKPYDLRHRWAIRTLEFGLELPLAAQQMGHSTLIHTQTYHAWISEIQHTQMFKALLQQPDRPMPPLS